MTATRLKAELGSVKSLIDEKIGTMGARVDRQLEEATRMINDCEGQGAKRNLRRLLVFLGPLFLSDGVVVAIAGNTRSDEMGLRVTQSAQENSDRVAEQVSAIGACF